MSGVDSCSLGLVSDIGCHSVPSADSLFENLQGSPVVEQARRVLVRLEGNPVTLRISSSLPLVEASKDVYVCNPVASPCPTSREQPTSEAPVETTESESPDIDDPYIKFRAQLIEIQAFISSFQYNYTGVMFYALKKTGGTNHILSIYDQIVAYRLPIQCVEAVFMAAVLTDKMAGVHRIPLCFKSKFKGHMHRHIVLAIHYRGRWGALGISRRHSLMDKPLVFQSLGDLIDEFRRCYQGVYHRLLTSYVGLPLPHQLQVERAVVWKALKVRLEVHGLSEASAAELRTFAAKHVGPPA